MTNHELLAEVRRLNKLLAAATKAIAAHYRTIDKLTAAQLRVQELVKKLERPR